jgi:hypothetical protein
MEEIYVGWSMLLKWILVKYDKVVYIGYISLRIGIDGGLL